MKRITTLLLIVITSITFTYAQVGIKDDGTAPDASAMLEIKTTNKGFLIPRVTDTTAVNNAATAGSYTVEEGLMIYDTTDKCLRYHNGTKWSGCISDFSYVEPINQLRINNYEFVIYNCNLQAWRKELLQTNFLKV